VFVFKNFLLKKKKKKKKKNQIFEKKIKLEFACVKKWRKNKMEKINGNLEEYCVFT